MLEDEKIIKEYLAGKSLSELADKYGTSPSVIREHLKKRKVKLRNFSEQMLFHSGGWRKLSRINYCKTRLVSIPAVLLVKAGFNPDKELFGKWKVGKGKLILTIKEG